MKVLYLTATGNSLYVAKRIGGELISIPRAAKEGKYEFSDDKVGLVFPIYGLAVPAFVESFIAKARLESPYVFAVMTYGMYDGGAANHLVQIAKGAGIKISYVRTIKMVDSWVLGFDTAKQIEEVEKKDIEGHLANIVSEVGKGEIRAPKASTFGKMLSKAYGGRGKFAIGPGVAKDFTVEDTCVGCGTCASVCAMGNVKLKDKRPQFGANCMSCLACTHNCPKNSIRVRKEKSRARYRNENVSLGEIKDSNH
jgi:ferredoxin